VVTAARSEALRTRSLGYIFSRAASAVPFGSRQNGAGQNPMIAVTVPVWWRDEGRQPLQEREASETQGQGLALLGAPRMQR